MDDTISRQAAIKEVTRNIPVKGWDDAERVTEIMKIFADRLKQLPPAQPERIKGWWIPVGGTLYQCYKCGAVSFAHKFCPDCGAEMEVTT